MTRDDDNNNNNDEEGQVIILDEEGQVIILDPKRNKVIEFVFEYVVEEYILMKNVVGIV